MNGEWQNARLFTIINAVGWLVCFGLCFWLKKAYGIGAGLLLLTGLFGWTVRDKAPLPYSARQWIAALGIYFTLIASLNFVLHQPLSSYDRLSRYLLAIPIVFSLWWFRPSIKVINSGISIGAVSAFAYAAYVRLWLGLPELELYRNVNHILFSNIAMMMAIMSGFLTLNFRHYSTQWLIAAIGAFFGITAAILGGGRGGWLMLLPALFIYGLAAKSEQRLKPFLTELAVLTLLMVIIACLPQFHLLEKISAIFNDISQYDAGNINTSQGGRLEMWRCGLNYMLPERPWLGWGDIGLFTEKARLIAAGMCDSSIAPYSHLHNGLIDTAVRYGIVGLLIKITFYTYPLVHYARTLKFITLTTTQRVTAWLGIAISTGFITASLTNATFEHNIANVFFVVIQAFCMTGIGEKPLRVAGRV